MVWPNAAVVRVDAADLRGEPRDDAELVDQAHFGETVRVLGARAEWRYVQGEDHYFGWIRASAVGEVSVYGEQRVVAAILAEVHERPDAASAVVARLPAGTRIPAMRGLVEGDGARREFAASAPGAWVEITLADPARPGAIRTGLVARDDTTLVRDLPHRPPTATDLIRTAEAFLGVPYLWGGTTATGLDCSGYVQQVYRLNGMGLDRDADQQATLGRPVDRARAGDLLFFGERIATHVALATGERTFLHAPERGKVVQRGELAGDRNLLATRRYLMDEGS